MFINDNIYIYIYDHTMDLTNGFIVMNKSPLLFVIIVFIIYI